MKNLISVLMGVVLAVSLVPSVSLARTDGSPAVEDGGSLAASALRAADDHAVLSGGADAGTADEVRTEVGAVSAARVGIGGHGAVFHPLVSPHDPSTFIAACDMGGVYATHDEGLHWTCASNAGRTWCTAADPTRAGVFYAGGSGLWRSIDNGDSWQLLWPNPDTVVYTPSRLNHSTTYYFTTDSYPDDSIVEAVRVDPGDSDHIVVLAAAAYAYANVSAHVCESFDGGATFVEIASFTQVKPALNRSFENIKIFVEPNAAAGASRVVLAIPDGIYEVDRSAAAATEALVPLYAAPGTNTIEDAAQVVDADGTHYVVLENVDDAAADELGSRVRLWHTLDFAATVDLTSEFCASLPRQYNSAANGSGENRELSKHGFVTLCAPSLERMYLGYRTLDTQSPGWFGICGLVTYDAARLAGERFFWTFGQRLYWNRDDAGARVTPDQNCLMARAHSDASFAFFGIAADPDDARRILLTTHTGLLYSPNIDADVGKWGAYDKVNIYPRYAVMETEDVTNGGRAANLNEYRMHSTGLDVTVSQHVRTDPFDESHLLIGMDDAGCANSYDGGATWSRFYTGFPTGATDTCFDAAFDEGREGVVYGVWHSLGGAIYYPQSRFFSGTSRFAVSTDGGVKWNATGLGEGLPANATIVRIAIDYPRDANGAITDGERTIYVATMGFGVYVSRDTGRTFTAMNAGIAPVDYTYGGTTYPAIWARDIMLAGDGRLFAMTQYSSLGPANQNGSTTYHSTQDERTFGNVWEWDAAADGGSGLWVRLPFNAAGDYRNSAVNVRQPRAFAYDDATRTLYVAAVTVVGPYVTSKRWMNFGGGLYTYTSAEGAAVGAGEIAHANGVPADFAGDQRSLTGVGFDTGGRLWVSAENGDVYVRRAGAAGGAGAAAADAGADADAGTARTPAGTGAVCRDAGAGWTQVYSQLLRLCRGFDTGANGKMYLDTYGVSALRVSYEEPESPEVPDNPGDSGVPGDIGGSGGPVQPDPDPDNPNDGEANDPDGESNDPEDGASDPDGEADGPADETNDPDGETIPSDGETTSSGGDVEESSGTVPAVGSRFVAGKATYQVASGSKRTVLYCGAPSGRKSVAVPGTVTHGGETYTVVGIASLAFSGSAARTVTMAASVKEIAPRAFYRASALVKVKVGSGVTRIGNRAFAQAAHLKSATIGKSVRQMGARLFAGCGKLTKITVATGKLTRSSAKTLASSSVRTVKLKGAAKTHAKAYKRIFSPARLA